MFRNFYRFPNLESQHRNCSVMENKTKNWEKFNILPYHTAFSLGFPSIVCIRSIVRSTGPNLWVSPCPPSFFSLLLRIGCLLQIDAGTDYTSTLTINHTRITGIHWNTRSAGTVPVRLKPDSHTENRTKSLPTQTSELTSNCKHTSNKMAAALWKIDDRRFVLDWSNVDTISPPCCASCQKSIRHCNMSTRRTVIFLPLLFFFSKSDVAFNALMLFTLPFLHYLFLFGVNF